MEDLSKIRQKVDAEVKAEQKYDLLNTTKIKAVEQTHNYEGFRDLVLAAHLKPVNLNETPLHQVFIDSPFIILNLR